MQTSLFYSCGRTNRGLLHASSFSRKRSSQYWLLPQELHHLVGTTISPRDNGCLLQCRTAIGSVSWGQYWSIQRLGGCLEGSCNRCFKPTLALAAPTNIWLRGHGSTYSSQQWPPLMGPPTWRHGEAGRLHRQADLALRPGHTV